MNEYSLCYNLGKLTRILQKSEIINQTQVFTKNIRMFLIWIERTENDSSYYKKIFNFLKRRYQIFWSKKRREFYDNPSSEETNNLSKKMSRILYFQCKKLITVIESQISDENKNLFSGKSPIMDFLTGYDFLYQSDKENKKKIDDKIELVEVNTDADDNELTDEISIKNAMNWIESWMNFSFFIHHPDCYFAFCIGRYAYLINEIEINEKQTLGIIKHMKSWVRQIKFDKLVRIFINLNVSGAYFGYLKEKSSDYDVSDPKKIMRRNTIPFANLRRIIEGLYVKVSESYENVNFQLLKFFFLAGFLMMRKSDNIQISKSKIIEYMYLIDDQNALIAFFLGKLYAFYTLDEINRDHTRSFKKMIGKTKIIRTENIPVIFNYIAYRMISLLSEEIIKKIRPIKSPSNKKQNEILSGEKIFEIVAYINDIHFVILKIIQNDFFFSNNKYLNTYKQSVIFMEGYNTHRSEKNNE